MTRYYYHKRNTTEIRRHVRWFGLFLFVIGILGLVYVFFPIISYEWYVAPVYASDNLASPIPKTAILSPTSLKYLIKHTSDLLQGTDYSNAANWYPTYAFANTNQSAAHHIFYVSIPKLGIENAMATNADNDLDHHLVNFAGTATPPEKGNAVIFGHSTLPQWFDPHNYKAIFATALSLKVGDKIIINGNAISYTYVIDRISIVAADDTSPLEQEYDDSYLTLITCTPPGTTWERLIIHSRLAKP